jgi:hypothetical protein
MTLFHAGLAGAVQNQYQILALDIILRDGCSGRRFPKIFPPQQGWPSKLRLFSGLRLGKS